MICEGKPLNKIILIPNEMTTIEFKVNEMKRVRYNTYNFCVDVVNNGTGDIHVNWRGDAIIDGIDSLLLETRQTYSIRQNIRTDSQTINLNIISANASLVQVIQAVAP